MKRSRSFSHAEEEEGEAEGDQSPENQEDLNNPVPPRFLHKQLLLLLLFCLCECETGCVNEK